MNIIQPQTETTYKVVGDDDTEIKVILGASQMPIIFIKRNGEEEICYPVEMQGPGGTAPLLDDWTKENVDNLIQEFRSLGKETRELFSNEPLK